MGKLRWDVSFDTWIALAFGGATHGRQCHPISTRGSLGGRVECVSPSVSIIKSRHPNCHLEQNAKCGAGGSGK